ncbi:MULTISPECIES: hypothetical protein [Haloarcula]|uniref:hypothetical protein n=1 Tax=Haloarcula TaxID=2237 RepID=UPI0023E8AA99|nr:hypothetical protein [Halomicroarcula sp. SHR3]
MTNFTIGRWLLVALAIVGLALAPGLGSAHGNDTAADDAPPYDETTDDWATGMDGHMTDHMGPGAVEWMESTMGVTVDEVAQDHADDDRHDRGTYRQGHC